MPTNTDQYPFVPQVPKRRLVIAGRLSRQTPIRMQAQPKDGVIWDIHEFKIFGVVIWRWTKRRVTTPELMRRVGIK